MPQFESLFKSYFQLYKYSISSIIYSCNCVFRSHERTLDDLEMIYEELLHLKALSHLSHTVKRELASVIVFEAHPHAGTVCKFSSYYEFNLPQFI